MYIIPYNKSEYRLNPELYVVSLNGDDDDDGGGGGDLASAVTDAQVHSQDATTGQSVLNCFELCRVFFSSIF